MRILMSVICLAILSACGGGGGGGVVRHQPLQQTLTNISDPGTLSLEGGDGCDDQCQ